MSQKLSHPCGPTRGLKKFRKSKKQEILELIAENKEWRIFYDNKGKEHKLSKEEVQGSKMRLLNVVFSDDFFESIITMNDRKLRPELDAGGAGSNKRRWAEVTDSYNDAMNNDEYGHYAFIEDDHIAEFVTTYDLCVFKQLDWQKAATWFKEIISDYTANMLQYSKSGNHEPDFMCYVDGKPQTYYYRLYAMENPECHKAFNVLLDDTLFSESTDITGSNKKIKLTKAPGSNEKKALILKDVAASMTEAFGKAQAKSATRMEQAQAHTTQEQAKSATRIEYAQAHSAKRIEKSRLEDSMNTVMMNLMNVPDGERGERARMFFNKKITENGERVEHLEEWFLENPSPSKK
jgi:hypothetical protein